MSTRQKFWQISDNFYVEPNEIKSFLFDFIWDNVYELTIHFKDNQV